MKLNNKSSGIIIESKDKQTAIAIATDGQTKEIKLKCKAKDIKPLMSLLFRRNLIPSAEDFSSAPFFKNGKRA